MLSRAASCIRHEPLGGNATRSASSSTDRRRTSATLPTRATYASRLAEEALTEYGEHPEHRSSRRVDPFLEQATRTAVANGRSKIEERLAHWLLMADDRIDG